MENKSENIFITTPIFYVNAAPHIGSLYTCILADCYARAYKFCGKNVKILTGTDEHGNKIEKSARDIGKNPMIFCNEISRIFKKMAVDFNLACSYEKFDLKNFNSTKETKEKFYNSSENSSLFNNGKNFIRTTNGRDEKTGEVEESQKNSHIKFIQEVWQRMIKNGWIYKGNYSGYYSIRDESFYGEDELIEGKAPTGSEVKFITEECYFYKLSAFQNILVEFLIDAQKNNNYLTPVERLSELIAFVAGENLKSALEGKLKPGHLQDIPVSRLKTENFTWGIPVPGDEKHLVYVWLDALFNYMSTFSIDFGLNLDEAFKEWKKHKTFHLLGKDIIKFHVIYWPTFLYAINFKPEDLKKSTALEDFKLGLFHKVLGHGWWTNEGEKISKSLGNIVDPYKEIQWLESFGVPEEIAIDYLRFFSVGCFSTSKDADYSRDALKEFINSNLVKNIGNLVQRSISLLEKFRDRHLGSIQISEELEKKYREVAFSREENRKNLIFAILNSLENFDLLYISRYATGIGNSANKSIENCKLWTLIDHPLEFVENIYHTFDSILIMAQVLSIICPSIGEKILKTIGCDMESKYFSSENLKIIKSDGIFLQLI